MEKFNYLLPFAVNFVRYFLIAGLAFLVFYKIYKFSMRANKIQKHEATANHFWRDILFTLQTIGVFGCVSILIMASPLHHFTRLYSEIHSFPLWWIPLSIFLALILHDTYFYWMHRMAHHPKLFKHVHITHHKSTNPSPWTSYAFGLTEGILEALIIPIILVIIPMHPLSIFLFTIIAFSINVYGHLGYEIMPKWFRKTRLFKLVNTSVYHNLHHEKFNGNYGLYFRFWDRWMKTENPHYEQNYDLVQEKRFSKNPPISISVEQPT